MAKVKLKQNGKVILKNGKVSCSCCEAGECCMYSAQALQDGLYTVDDLPDAVTLNYDLVQNFELTRSGSEFIGVFDQTVTYKVLLGTLPENEEYQWLLYVNDQLDDNYRCLILGDGNLTPSNDIVEDQFADTYTVKFLDKEVSVNRDSLCFWSGFIIENEVFLYQADLRFNDEKASEENGLPYGWIAGFTTTDISSGVLSKSGNQNTPVGVYPGEYEITVL